MSNVDRMRELVAKCPWLGADNLMDAANSNMDFQDAVGKCWRALLDDGDVDALEAAVDCWGAVGVVSSSTR